MSQKRSMRPPANFGTVTFIDAGGVGPSPCSGFVLGASDCSVESAILCRMDPPTRHELPVVERTAARLVVLDAAGRVLLLHVQDLSNPQFGTVWELPGGGIEPGETYSQAALRELREETGIEVAPERIEAPRWRRQIEYVYRGTCWHQHELVGLVRLDASSPGIDDSLRVGNEREDVLGARWWSIEQIVASDQRFYPLSLATALPRFLRGESIEEELERWPGAG